jgi:hypothetical protein
MQVLQMAGEWQGRTFKLNMASSKGDVQSMAPDVQGAHAPDKRTLETSHV